MVKIDTNGWGEFKIGELFEISRPVARSQQMYREGNIPFVASGNFNNGIIRYCEPKENELLDKGNCITVSPLDGSAFYQPTDFLGRGGAGSAILVLQNENLNCMTGLFIASAIRSSLTRYSYSDQLNSQSIALETVKLPQDSEGKPDFAYMDEYMQNIIQQSKTSLNNLKTCSTEKTDVDISRWKEFNLCDVFDMSNTKSIVQKSIVPDSGNIPYVTASSENNGVMTYIKCPEEWVDNGNCIMIGGKTLTFTYQAEDFCSNDSHNIALYIKESGQNTKMHYLFLIAALRASLGQRYFWGDSISMKRIINERFFLPADENDNPDWAHMDNYMKSVMNESRTTLKHLTV